MTHLKTARLVLAAVLAAFAVLVFGLVLWLVSLEGRIDLTMTPVGRRFFLTDLLAVGALCGLCSVLLWQRRSLGVFQTLLVLLLVLLTT